MKRSQSPAIAALLLGLPIGAWADTSELDLAIGSCLDAISSAVTGFEGRDAAMPFANTIVTIAKDELAAGNIDRVIDRLNGDGAKCISFVRQVNDDLNFYPELGDFFTSIAAQAQLDLARNAELEERENEIRLEAAAIKAELEAKQKALETEVNSRVFIACAQLANRDPLAAFTNDLCVRSFKANGLPE